MADEGDEGNLFGVDYEGRVWKLSNGHSYTWKLLHNPTKLNIKRVVSFSKVLWGLGSDHQIYCYIHKKDIPIRVREEVYENQRWNPVESFTGTSLLPTDRAPFSNYEGTQAREKGDKLPSEAWIWEGPWEIENTFQNELVPDGWSYAIDFPASYSKEKSFKSFVRRRKLYRYRKFIGSDRWCRIESLHADHTQEPFIDLAVGGRDGTICCLWAISILGEVYFRSNTTTTSNPEGDKWLHIPIRKGLEACQICVGGNGSSPFVVTWNGSFMFRVGVTSKCPQGKDWLESEGPPGGLLQLAAGRNCLWAITRDRKCWTLKGNWPEVAAQMEPKFDWIEIPGNMKSISIGKTDDIVLGLSDDELSVLHLRVGICDDQKYGQCWKPVFDDIEWDTTSIASGTSHIDNTDHGGSSESLVSLKPDIPQPPTFDIPTSDADELRAPNCFSWVDGAGASCLRVRNDNDMLIGPWRDDILLDLQKLNMQKRAYPFPDAVEGANTCWSKSTRVKFLHASRKAKWVDGQLEISNNNHLVFHESLDKTWLCSVTDILSVFGGAFGTKTITCRIRNSLEPGIAEFVNFKFSNDKEMEEWRIAILELADKPLEDFSVSDIWLTARGGEVHRGGQLRILDLPVESEVVTCEPGGDFKLHHPLVRGFMPDSEIIMDINIPKGAERFSINLKGGSDVITAFHFNPRFGDHIIVRNSFSSSGEWGEEEKDGTFPFREGQKYTVQIQCTATHILTNVIVVFKTTNKFMFTFKHRFPPKVISNLYVYGDVSVTSVRYNPSLRDTYELEFVTTGIPGHFWKVEAASNGHVWALAFDLKVWCFTGSSKHHKVDGAALGSVTDEEVRYVYENERWNPIQGFGGHALPTDREKWTDETGRVAMEKDDVRLPSSEWAWITDWEVDYDVPEGCDDSGWQYAIDFPAHYHSCKRINDFVRRRRWKRMTRLTVIGPWQCVPGIKLVDLCIRMNEDCEWEVLGLTPNLDAVSRNGISPECPTGDAWNSLPTEKPFVSISGWYGKPIWAVGKDGFSYIRYANSWQMLDRPRETPLKQVRVGSNSTWSVGTNNVLYRRSEVQAAFPEGREWIRVCDGVSQVSIAPDGTVWALLKSEDPNRCSLAKRMGVSMNAAGGLGWEIISVGPWTHLSSAGLFSRNK